jgi:hypothetical protein
MAMIIPDIRSLFYCSHFWIFRGAKFPFKMFKLWMPTILSECLYAGGQGLFIFFVAPYLEDSTMILGSFLVISVPIIQSIISPEYRYTSCQGSNNYHNIIWWRFGMIGCLKGVLVAGFRGHYKCSKMTRGDTKVYYRPNPQKNFFEIFDSFKYFFQNQLKK